MTTEHSSKRCTKCGEEKLLSEFFNDPRRKDGKRAKCKPCFPRSKAKKRTPEKRAADRRKYEGVSREYVPRAVILQRAAEKRAPKYDAHVVAWVVWMRKEEKRAAGQALHDSHVRLFRSRTIQFRLKYKSDPGFAVQQRLRTQLRKKAKLFPKLDDLMRAAIKRCGTSPTVECVCGYSIAELVVRLERQFTQGMTWERFLEGKIHIDHIRPQCMFDLSCTDQVRACWSLSNLRPLWAEDNLAKGARFDGHSQRVPLKVPPASRDLRAPMFHQL
jgi:hypothetical protein